MATKWLFDSANSGGTTSGSASSATTPLITPQHVGDLMVCMWGDHRATTADSSVAISDSTGGTWIAHPVGMQSESTNSAMMWWRLATQLDVNTGVAVTATPAGGTGSITNHLIQCDVYTLPGPAYYFIGVDLTAGAVVASTTKSFSPAAGSSYASFTDALAVTLAYSNGHGAPTGTNTFTGTSSAKNLTLNQSGGDASLQAQYAAGVQGSATAGTNVFINTWTTSSNNVVFGMTFVYATYPSSTYELDEALQIKAGTAKGTPASVSANVLASTTNREMVEALNILAGNPKKAYRELAGVLNQLAGTTGLEPQAAASHWAGRQ